MDPNVKTQVIILDTIEAYNKFKEQYYSILSGVTLKQETINEIYSYYTNYIFNNYRYIFNYFVNFLNTQSNELDNSIYWILEKNKETTHEDTRYFVRQTLANLGISIWFEMNRSKLNVNEFGNDRSDEKDTYTVNRIESTYIILTRYSEL